MSYKSKILFLIALVCLLFTQDRLYAEQQVYVLARAPQLSASLLARDWTPFIIHLSQQVGAKVQLKVYQNRALFELDIKNGSVDFYFANPGYAVVGHERHGYQPLVRSDARLLHGILVTHKDSHIKSLQQLKNEALVFPSENAFAASLYLRSHLENIEKLDFNAVFIGTHDNVYRSVVIGEHVAGGGVQRTLDREPAQLKDKLRILYTTPGVRPHPLMAHPRVPRDLQGRVQQTILAMQQTESGRQLLQGVGLSQPVISDYHHDYAPLSTLVHDMYADLYR